MSGIFTLRASFAAPTIVDEKLHSATTTPHETMTEPNETSKAAQEADMHLSMAEHVSGNPVQANTQKTAVGQMLSYVAMATASVTDAATAECALALSIVPSMLAVAPGGENTYTITLENKGTASCTNPSFSVYYDAGESVVSVSPTATAGNYYWTQPSLAAGASMQVSVRTKHKIETGVVQIKTEVCATAGNASEDVCKEVLTPVGALSQQNTNTPAPAPQPTPAPVVEVEPVVIEQPEVVVAAPTVTPSFVAPAGKEFGLWIWESPMKSSDAYMVNALTVAQANGFGVVYITIDDFVDVAGLADGSTKQAKKAEYMARLSRVVGEAQARGIAVDVLGGWKDWAMINNRWKAYALIDFVREYNALYPAKKVRGLQFDVEPYLLSTYEKNKATTLRTFVSFVDEVTTRMQGVDASLSIVIPHFYDSTQKWTPAISYAGKTKHTYTHLLDILQRKPGSTIIIMAYRNFVDGQDGTRQISEPEVKEASQGGYATYVIVAQETGNVDPAYVTFHDTTRQTLFAAVTKVYDIFKGYTRFGGVAVHYLEPFTELR